MIGISVVQAAADIGVSNVSWRYWERGDKIPSRENMTAIFEWSSGLVTPNDFYDLPDMGGDDEGQRCEFSHTAYAASGIVPGRGDHCVEDAGVLS